MGVQVLLLGLVFLPVIIIAGVLAIGTLHYFLMGGGSAIPLGVIVGASGVLFVVLYVLPMCYLYDLCTNCIGDWWLHTSQWYDHSGGRVASLQQCMESPLF
jgi:hypothetical protein